jgi:hypothetical protein
LKYFVVFILVVWQITLHPYLLRVIIETLTASNLPTANTNFGHTFNRYRREQLSGNMPKPSRLKDILFTPSTIVQERVFIRLLREVESDDDSLEDDIDAMYRRALYRCTI